MPLDDLENIKNEIPYVSPIEPVELTLDSALQFDCHKGISCFNACCKNIDITITPYDILRLKRRLNMTSSEWVNRYTVPYPMDAHDMPGLKLATQPNSNACVFLTPEGCGVYQDRPMACRYYALGSMGVKRQNATVVDDVYFLVKENHCQGHQEPRTLTVRDYLREQGLPKYQQMSREWRDIILKKRSSGPTVGKPSARSLQLFDLCSYDIDSFRDFIQSKGFTAVFDIPAQEMQTLLQDEDQLLLFAMRFLKQVLFGEITIALHADAEQSRHQHRAHRAHKQATATPPE